MSESKSLATALASLSETKDRSSKNSKFDDPKLDPVWLYEELRKEISKEATYNLENDAKFRAVSQGTVNYEQFRQMVLGAHLKPLERKDKMEGCQNGKKPYVVWNTASKKTSGRSAGEQKDSAQIDETIGKSLETNVDNKRCFQRP